LFLAPSIGLGMLLLAAFERFDGERPVSTLAILGGAPMFFYIVHLYTLKALYFSAVAIWGLNEGKSFGFDHVWMIWTTAACLAIPLYFPASWFAQFKQRRRDLWWPRYL
jgi:hypothetical protein